MKNINKVTLELKSDFNPLVFPTLWFSENNILKEKYIKKVNPKASISCYSFSTDFLDVQITKKRFILTLKDYKKLQVLKKFLLRIFKTYEIKEISVLYEKKYRAESKQEFYKIQNIIPINAWSPPLRYPQIKNFCIEENFLKKYPSIYTTTISINNKEYLSFSIISECKISKETKIILRSWKYITKKLEELTNNNLLVNASNQARRFNDVEGKKSNE